MCVCENCGTEEGVRMMMTEDDGFPVCRLCVAELQADGVVFVGPVADAYKILGV